MAIRIQLRHGTAAAWTAANPILAIGEVGVEIDTGAFKVGDGATTWASLVYSGVSLAVFQAHAAAVASTSALGHVKVDGVTITADVDGTLRVVGAAPTTTVGDATGMDWPFTYAT